MPDDGFGDISSLGALRLSPEISNPVRQRLRAHFDSGGQVKDLDIEPDRPPVGLAFAVVAFTPYAPRSKHRYRCSYCQTNDKFGRGPIVLMSDGKLRLIGPDCWRDHFEHEAFAAETAELDLYIRRESFQKIRPDLIRAVHHYEASLQDSWSLGRDAFLRADQFGSRLGKQLPQLYTELHNASRAGGKLQVVRRLTARQREIEMENASTQRRRAAPDERPETIAVVSGLNILLPRLSESTVQHGLAKLQAAHECLTQTKWADLGLIEFGRQLAAIERKLKSAFDAAESIAIVVRDARDLLARHRLAQLMKWASDPDWPLAAQGKLRLQGNSLCFEYFDGTLKRVDFPDVEKFQSVPNTEPIARLLKRLHAA